METYKNFWNTFRICKCVPNLERKVSYLGRCKLQTIDRTSVLSTQEIYHAAALWLRGSGLEQHVKLQQVVVCSK